MKKGEIITENDIVTLRPNNGIDARDYSKVIGQLLKKNTKKLKKLTFNLF